MSTGAMLLGLGGVAILVAVAPPVGVLAREHVFVEALQFALLAFCAPALIASGIGRLETESGRARPTRSDRGAVAGGGHRVAILALLLFVAVSVLWRTPPAVDAVRSLVWVLVLEVASLLGCGIALWLLITGPIGAGVVPQLTLRERPLRMLFAAVPMWATWIAAYALGFSSRSWFPGYHLAGAHGLGVVADQQLAAGVLFAAAGLAFVPVVFANLTKWLASQEDAPRDASELFGGDDAG